MYVYVRLLACLVKARFLPRLEPLAEATTRIRIWPNDLDFNWHLNNGRYLTLCDLGRLDHTMRSGLWKIMLRRRWLPVLSTAAIRFRRSIAPFALVDLKTRIVYWDAKWFYIEHRFEQKGEVMARALVKGLFRSPQGPVSIDEMLKAMAIDAERPPEPEGVRLWREFEAAALAEPRGREEP